MMLPITIPALVGALGLVILYDRTGWLNVVLLDLGLISNPLRIDYTIHGLILFYVWMFFPYGALVIMSGLGAIDPALEEAGGVMRARVRWWCSAACCCRCCAAACGRAA